MSCTKRKARLPSLGRFAIAPISPPPEQDISDALDTKKEEQTIPQEEPSQEVQTKKTTLTKRKARRPVFAHLAVGPLSPPPEQDICDVLDLKKEEQPTPPQEPAQEEQTYTNTNSDSTRIESNNSSDVLDFNAEENTTTQPSTAQEAQTHPEINADPDPDPTPSDDDTLYGTDSEDEEAYESSMKKCEGKTDWCQGLCLPENVSLIGESGIEETPEVRRENLCMLAVLMRNTCEEKRRDGEREGSRMRRERVRRIKTRRGEFKRKVPWWGKAQVYVSSPLGWDNGFWREDLD